MATRYMHPFDENFEDDFYNGGWIINGEIAPVTNPGPKDYAPPTPRIPQVIIDYEKKTEEKIIKDKRPTISIEDITDPERN